MPATCTCVVNACTIINVFLCYLFHHTTGMLYKTGNNNYNKPIRFLSIPPHTWYVSMKCDT